MPITLIPTDHAALGRRLRLARERRGVSVAMAAKRAGLVRDDIVRLERGRLTTTTETLLTLTGLYGCRLWWLLTGIDDQAAEAAS